MKIKIDMLSRATSAPAQGVGSVYIEQTQLMKELGKDDFEIYINKHSSKMDIYHIHSVNPTFYLRMTKKRTTVCFVHFMPDTLVGSVKLPKVVFKIFAKYVVSFYKKAKEIVVVNPSYIQELTDYGIRKDKITFIPNFVSEKDFFRFDDIQREKTREKYSVPKNAFVVLGVGQVQTRKGIFDFIKASEENPDMFFVWAGGFSFKNITDGYLELKKEMKKKRKNLLFLGIIPREKMNEVYNLADVFFLPSYSELFPMALIESVHTGCPYIVRDLDVYKDILPKDYLCASDNDGFNAILRLLKTDESFYKDSLEEIKEFKKMYSRESIYDKWEEYYKYVYLKYNANKKD